MFAMEVSMTVRPLVAPAIGLATLMGSGPAGLASQDGPGAGGDAGWEADPPAIAPLLDFAREQSDLRTAIARYGEDRSALLRRYDVDHSPLRRQRLAAFYQGWQSRLDEVDFASLNHEGQIDCILLKHRLAFELEMLEQEQREETEMAPLVPFARRIQELQEIRRDRKDVDAQGSAQTLSELVKEVDKLTQDLKAEARKGG